MSILLPKFNFESLDPFLSQRTLDFHINKHLNAYINNANNLIKGTDLENKDLSEIVKSSSGALFNNAAQAFNHIFYFNGLCASTAPMSDKFRAELEKNFGSYEKFKEEFKNKAVSNFGSGWTWLVKDDNSGKMLIENTSNADNPMIRGLRLLLCIDVWEHAYYLDYQNLRGNYVDQFFDHIDWKFVEANCN